MPKEEEYYFDKTVTEFDLDVVSQNIFINLFSSYNI